jgi:hypothetical protein
MRLVLSRPASLRTSMPSPHPHPSSQVCIPLYFWSQLCTLGCASHSRLFEIMNRTSGKLLSTIARRLDLSDNAHVTMMFVLASLHNLYIFPMLHLTAIQCSALISPLYNVYILIIIYFLSNRFVSFSSCEPLIGWSHRRRRFYSIFRSAHAIKIEEITHWGESSR